MRIQADIGPHPSSSPRAREALSPSSSESLEATATVEVRFIIIMVAAGGLGKDRREGWEGYVLE